MTQEVVDELGEQIAKGFSDYHAEDGFFWGQQFQKDSVKEYKEQDAVLNSVNKARARL